MDIGNQIYDLAYKLFPICRSITGDGVRETLDYLKSVVPELMIHKVPSGTQVFDWVVPKEWNIRDGFIADNSGKKIVDFKENNLHIMGYSTPVDKIVSKQELLEIVYTSPDQPDLIPYVTSYYKQRYGFCMSENQKNDLKDEYYHIYIDSDLTDGFLNYGEIILKGKTEKEVFLSTYICHPSMANNELSGPCVAIYLAKWLSELENRRYTYRIIFIPETIGSITYLSQNIESMKKNIVAGFNLSCVGDERCFSYLPSRNGDTLSDKVALNTLRSVENLKKYTFLDRGSDERQYCSPMVDLPVCSIMRSKYGEYPEYHTSADNMTLITPLGLAGTYNIYVKCLKSLENNYRYKVKCLGEPQLGKRGLYPTTSFKGSAALVRGMMNFIAHCDGKNDLIDISNIINVSVDELIPIANKLMDADLLEIFHG